MEDVATKHVAMKELKASRIAQKRLRVCYEGVQSKSNRTGKCEMLLPRYSKCEEDIVMNGNKARRIAKKHL